MPRPKKGHESDMIRRYHAMCEYYDYPHTVEETAEKFGMSVSTVKALLYSLRDGGCDDAKMAPNSKKGIKWAIEWNMVTSCYREGRFGDLKKMRGARKK